MGRRVIAIAAVLVGAASLASCIEGPFEPFAPERDQPVLRFIGGAAPAEPFVWLAGVASTDSTIVLEVRLRNAPRVSALAFELAIESPVLAVDSITPGNYFTPVGQVPLVNVAASPGSDRRIIGVATVPQLDSASAGTGTIATLHVRRTATAPFDVVVAFDTTTSAAFGPGGTPIPMQWARGRLVHVPKPAATASVVRGRP